jgi:hypothetical protein
LVFAVCAAGCRNLTAPTKLCVQEALLEDCRPAAEVEALLRDPRLEIRASRPTPSGRQNARILTLVAAQRRQPVRFRAKWRALSTAHGLNDPRKELATHGVQKLFLDERELVFPPTTGRCFELAAYRRAVTPDEQASLPGTECVYGTLSYWLEGAHAAREARLLGWLEAPGLFDEKLFYENSTYRRTIADVNLLSHLVDHGDTHSGQFLLTGFRHRPHVYVVDTTIAFSAYRNPTLLPRDDWSSIQVPALSARSVARLRGLSRQKVARLATIEQYEIRNGQLLPTAITRPASRADAGLRRVANVVQVGLTERELDSLWRRIQGVLARVDRGETRTF